MKTLETKLFSAHASQSSGTIDSTANGTKTSFTGSITLTSRYIKPSSLIIIATITQTSFTLSAANGVALSYSGTISLVGKSIKPSTVSITATISASPVVITDNGSGVLAGTGVTGTINYSTGAYALTFTTAPDNSTNITCVYDGYHSITDDGNGVLTGTITTGTINYGTGAYLLAFTSAPKNSTNITATYDYTVTTPIQVTGGSTGISGETGKLIYEGNLLDEIVPGSVSFAINFSSSPVTFSDDINGNFSGTGLNYGYIEYQTGVFKLVFTTAPDNAAALTATYQHRSSQINEELIGLKFEDSNCLVVRHNHSTTQYFHLAWSEDNSAFTYVGTYFVVPGGLKIVQLFPRKYYRIYSSNCQLKCQLEVL